MGVNVNIKGLVEFRSKYPPLDNSTIELALGNYKDCASVTVEGLERRLLLLLLDSTMQISVEHLGGWDVELPHIWIDGYGNLIKTDFSTPL